MACAVSGILVLCLVSTQLGSLIIGLGMVLNCSLLPWTTGFAGTPTALKLRPAHIAATGVVLVVYVLGSIAVLTGDYDGWLLMMIAEAGAVATLLWYSGLLPRPRARS